MSLSAEVSARWDNLERGIRAFEMKITKENGARDQLLDLKKQESAVLLVEQENQRVCQQAQLFLLSELTERRQKAVSAIENMGSSALRQVYGAGYRLKFQTFDEKRKETGQNNFKMEIMVGSLHDGEELLTGLIGERGGGVVEIVAFALRIAALNWKNYDGPLIMDEAYKSMSNDEKLESVARFLREVTVQTGRQIIFATHKADIFGRIAQRVVVVEKNDGIASVRVVQNTETEPETYIEEF